MKSFYRRGYRYIYRKIYGKEKIVIKNAFDIFYSNKKLSTDSYNNVILEDEEANSWLFNKIKSGEPFFASRFGDGELSLACNFLFNKLLNGNFWSERSKKTIGKDNGWGGDIMAHEKFYEIFLKDISQLDAIGVWYNHGEQIMTNYLCPKSVLFNLPVYESFFYNNPWTLALKNKRVLVIHLYTSSIPKQYKKRKLLFNKEVLPDFELQCYKPFSTYDEQWRDFDDSKQALDKMIEDVSKLNFDIALVAAGQYGFPLSAAIKRMGKQAIHIGGALQLLFGIKGKRWENPDWPHMNYFNENWVRPEKSEIPTDVSVMKFTEGGTYW